MFPESPLATTITVLTPVSCCYMTSFNYGGKKTRDVGLTCRCHLSNIMPDSIYHDSMGCGTTQFLLVFFVYLFVCLLFRFIFCFFVFWVFLLFFFLRSGNRCLPQHRRDGFILITITPVGVVKP